MFDLNQEDNRKARNTPTGAQQDKCATVTGNGNSLISDLRRKLWHKAECHERDVAEVRQALDDLNDPIVQKVLNILHLANP